MAKSATPRGVLTAKQIKFVEEYLVDMNATQAAIRAGYSKKTAGKIGYENLQKPDIASAISAKRLEVTAATGVTIERVIREMARIAFSDPRAMFDANGRMVAIKDMSDEAAAALASFEVDELFDSDGEGGKVHVGVTRKVKLWDKGKQLENLLKHLGAEGGKAPEPIGGVMAATPGLDALVGKLASIIRSPKVES